MNVGFRHIITLIIALFISFTANADMSHPASSNFSDVFATTTDRYQYSGKEFDRMNGLDLYLFHEIAERFIGANPTRGEVIDYENIVRDILNIEKRPYDTNHSYKINTISQ